MVNRLCRLFVVSSLAVSAVATAQSPPPPATLLEQARAARSAGRLQETRRVVDEILAVSPGNREAAQLKIDLSLEARDVDGALQAYDRYVQATRKDDGTLLGSIARAESRALAAGGSGERLRIAALETQARGGDGSARRALAQAAGHERTLTGEGLLADASLAQLGDLKAIARLGELTQAQMPHLRIAAVDALKAAGARASGFIVRALLEDADPGVKAAAADAVGALQLREAVPQLKALLEHPILLVRLTAAVALKRLGDRTADALLARSLTSDLADVRLLAARAYTIDESRAWSPAIRSLLADPSGLTRLHAAELLLASDAPAARDVLLKAVEDPNPTVRAEAARILAPAMPHDFALLRRLLRDDNPWVRLHAASAIMAASAPRH